MKIAEKSNVRLLIRKGVSTVPDKNEQPNSHQGQKQTPEHVRTNIFRLYHISLITATLLSTGH